MANGINAFTQDEINKLLAGYDGDRPTQEDADNIALFTKLMTDDEEEADPLLQDMLDSINGAGPLAPLFEKLGKMPRPPVWLDDEVPIYPDNMSSEKNEKEYKWEDVPAITYVTGYECNLFAFLGYLRSLGLNNS